MLTATKKSVIDPLHRAKGRLLIAAGVFVVAFTAVGFRLADLTILGSEYVRKASVEQAVEKSIDANFRADILDRNGEILATSLKAASLYADPSLIRDPHEVATRLLTVLPDLKKDILVKSLSDHKKRFVWIKRGLTPEQQYAANRLGIPGLEFEEEYVRFYPHGETTSHVIGFTDVDQNGLAGIEKSMADHLKLEPVKLSIDMRVQYFMHDALERTIKKFNAIGGAGLVMHARTGEIVAMVSMPTFNPQHPNLKESKNRFNMATLGVYEMGSTFKLLSAAAALEGNVISVADRFDCREPFKYGRHTISDFHPQKRVMTFPEVFIHSSNIGYAQMAEKLGTARMKKFYEAIGLFESPLLEIPERGRPLIPSPWRDINTITASYGHGIAITPVQLVAATATIVNGGFKVKPTLVKQDSPVLGERAVSASTSDKIRELMRLVVTEGTGAKADLAGYMVGGKTGTSEKQTGKKYDRNKRISSFVAAFPINKPEYVILAMIDEPKGTTETFGYATGGWVAAPVVADVISKSASLLNIRPFSADEIAAFDQNMAINNVPRKKKGEKE